MLYTRQNLPPFLPGTAGHMLPKPEGTVAACVAPVDTDWPYPQGWGKGPDATMAVSAGQWVVCLGPGDSYLNAEFELTSTPTGVVWEDPQDDPRAAELAKAWLDRGYRVQVIEARKTVGVIVHGEVSPDAVGQDLLTREGPETLAAGDLIVESPRTGDLWRITPANRAKRYLNAGEIFPGDLPADAR